MPRHHLGLAVCFVVTMTPSISEAVLPVLASDEMPEGDDEMPDGDDEMPIGSDEPNRPPESEDDMPPGEEEDVAPAMDSPSLVAVPPTPKCSLPARSEGYLQAQLDRPRSLDLHGLTASVQLLEGDEGCIGQAEVTIGLQANCSLTMSFSQVSDRNFEIESLRLNANQCAELVGLSPGRYLLNSGNASLKLEGESQRSCMSQARLTIEGELSVKRDREILPLNLDGIRVKGDFPVLVDRTIGCRQTRRSAPITLSSDRPPPKQSHLALGCGRCWRTRRCRNTDLVPAHASSRHGYTDLTNPITDQASGIAAIDGEAIRQARLSTQLKGRSSRSASARS